MEIWREVAGMDGRYLVSDQGRVARVFALSPTSHGYRVAALRLNARTNKATRYVHHLVLEAFEGPKPSPQHVANHLDGDKANNHRENLEWATVTENNLHAHRTGLNKGMKGKRRSDAKSSWYHQYRMGGITWEEYKARWPTYPHRVVPVIKRCPICGNDFMGVPSKMKKRVTCGKECQRLHHRTQRWGTSESSRKRWARQAALLAANSVT